ncbi:DUF3387 domain-containing protein [Candidatus Bathyarchaeota archaeon]|nr:DUF3387 domain-containing protein [Candidatus Bathyarchaeota archaeon]
MRIQHRLKVLLKEEWEAHKRGEELDLTEEELAFYDALEVLLVICLLLSVV